MKFEESIVSFKIKLIHEPPHEYCCLAFLFIVDSSMLTRRVSFETNLANLIEKRFRIALILSKSILLGLDFTFLKVNFA